MIKKLSIKITISILALLSAFCVCFGLGGLNVSAQEKLPSSIKLEVLSGDYNSYDLPFGVVGQTYPVFDCVAKDNLGNLVENVDVFVFNPLGQGVSIVDGRFSTATEGDYKVVYTATAGGLFKERELKITVKPQDEYVPMSYAVSDALISSANTGDDIYLYDGKISGGFGNVDLNMTIEYTGEYACDNIQTYNYTGVAFFRPEVSGLYTLTYTLGDITGQSTQRKWEITVTDSNLPIIKMPTISKVFHVGEQVNLPTSEAFVYYKGHKILVPVKVEVENGANKVDVTADMTFTPNEEGDYRVIYSAENVFEQGYKTVESVDVKAIKLKSEVKTEMISKYLYLDGFTGKYRNDGDKSYEQRVYVLTADGSKDVAQMSFKNKLPLEFASIMLGVETTKFNYDSITVTYVDSEDFSQQIDFTFAAGKGGVDTFLNGQFVKTLTTQSFDVGTAYSKATVDVAIDYASGELFSNVLNESLCMPTVYKNGQKYLGFTSGAVYVSVKIENIDAESQLKLYEIGFQKINGAYTDNNVPVIVKGDYTAVSVTELGYSVVIPKLKTFDLYDSNIVLKLKVTSPSDEVVFYDVLDKDYILLAKEIGIYDIKYEAIDSANKVGSLIGNVKVVDRTAPEIKVSNVKTSVKVGDKAKFPAAVITDDSDCLTWIYITYGNFERYTVTDGTFKFKKAGVYTVKYGAMDADGNRTIVEYQVVCK